MSRKNKKKKWVQKCDVDEMQDKNLPLPTQIISNEEFIPSEQTAEQEQVEQRLIEIANESSKKLNISRRKFLASTRRNGGGFFGDEFCFW